MNAAPETPASTRSDWGWILSTFGTLLGLVLTWAFFALVVWYQTGTQDFATVGNSQLILLLTAVVGTAAVGATLIIISGGIDLSVGASIALGTMVVALMLNVPIQETGPNRGEWITDTDYQTGDVLQRLKRAGSSDQAAEYDFYRAMSAHKSQEKSELGNENLWSKVTAVDGDGTPTPMPGQGTVVIRMTMTHRMPVLWPLVAALTGVLAGVLVGLVIGAMVTGYIGRAAAGLTALTTVLWLWSYGWIIALLAGAVVLVAVAIWGERVLGRLKLSPFIVTLGLWGALRGVAKGLGDNQPIYPKYGLTWLQWLMKKSPGQVLPWGVWLMIAVALLAAGLLRYTRLGRHIYAIGSNEETARLCGVNIQRTKLKIYMLAIACAGLAAVLQFSSLGIGDPTTAQGFELKVIAAVVIGGASLSGGTGTILGTLTGALIMTVVSNGCTKLGIDNWQQDIVTGAIIVAAVTLDEWRKRRAV